MLKKWNQFIKEFKNSDSIIDARMQELKDLVDGLSDGQNFIYEWENKDDRQLSVNFSTDKISVKYEFNIDELSVSKFVGETTDFVESVNSIEEGMNTIKKDIQLILGISERKVIKNPNNFIVEKIKSNLFLLLETFGVISGSSEFAKKLQIISKESGKTGEIAKYIMNMLEDFESEGIKQNYFNLTDKPDMVSFAMQDKVDKAECNDEDGNVDAYSLKSRGEVKIGKIIKYLCELKPYYTYNGGDMIKVTDKDIEAFVNTFKALKSNDSREFRLVGGKDIAKYYNADRYFNSNGTLGGSCMKNEGKDFFKLYSRNPDKVQLLVLFDEKDKVHGRALLWRLSKSPCEAKYLMDRVYTNSDSDIIKFIKFAETQGWMHKLTNNSWCENAIKFSYNNKPVYGEVVIEDIDGDFDNYPFLDTMAFLSPDKKTLSNLPDKGCYMLHSTYGRCETCGACDGDVITCNECGGTGISECSTCDGDGKEKCGSCNGHGLIECDYCDGDGWLICDECDGEGKTEGKTKMINCKSCKGDGKVKCAYCKGKSEIKCEDCQGKGEFKCTDCDGKGKVKCDDCDLCRDCASGHDELCKLGIETKWNKRFLKIKR